MIATAQLGTAFIMPPFYIHKGADNNGRPSPTVIDPMT